MIIKFVMVFASLIGTTTCYGNGACTVLVSLDITVAVQCVTHTLLTVTLDGYFVLLYMAVTQHGGYISRYFLPLQ